MNHETIERPSVPQEPGPSGISALLIGAGDTARVEPPWSFADFERRAQAVRRRRRLRRGAVAAAAMSVLAIALLLNWSAWQPASRGAGAQPRQPPVAVPMAEQRADQSWLALLPSEPEVVSVETRIAVVELEDRIAWIDDSLSASSAHGDVLVRINQLQNERARLVDSLVRVRYAEQLVAASR